VLPLQVILRLERYACCFKRQKITCKSVFARGEIEESLEEIADIADATVSKIDQVLGGNPPAFNVIHDDPVEPVQGWVVGIQQHDGYIRIRQ